MSSPSCAVCSEAITDGFFCGCRCQIHGLCLETWLVQSLSEGNILQCPDCGRSYTLSDLSQFCYGELGKSLENYFSMRCIQAPPLPPRPKVIPKPEIKVPSSETKVPSSEIKEFNVPIFQIRAAGYLIDIPQHQKDRKAIRFAPQKLAQELYSALWETHQRGALKKETIISTCQKLFGMAPIWTSTDTFCRQIANELASCGIFHADPAK